VGWGSIDSVADGGGGEGGLPGIGEGLGGG
jgi:hypothetical protein